jgi:hypothetical protein
MPDERRRHQLYQELGGLLTQDSVDELMNYLPPVGWADVATKADLGILRGDIEALRAELKGDMAKLEGRFDKLEGRFEGLEGRFGGLEGRFEGLEGRFEGLEGRFGGLEGQVDAKIAKATDTVRAWAIGLIVAIVISMVGTMATILVTKP